MMCKIITITIALITVNQYKSQLELKVIIWSLHVSSHFFLLCVKRIKLLCDPLFSYSSIYTVVPVFKDPLILRLLCILQLSMSDITHLLRPPTLCKKMVLKLEGGLKMKDQYIENINLVLVSHILKPPSI